MQDRVYEYFLNNHKDILICENAKEAMICSEVANFIGYETFVLPDFRAVYGDDLRFFNDEIMSLSFELSKFYKSKALRKLIITPFKTILNKLPSKKHLQNKSINLGDKININELKDELVRFGYELVDIVEANAEASIRGEVIDIFPVGARYPFRVLLDLDEVESIKKFDVDTQLSQKDELLGVEITPFMAFLQKDEYDKTQNLVNNFKSNSLINDIKTLGFWAIDDFIYYLDNFSAILLHEIDDLILNKKLEILPQAKNLKI